jgi:hypothetical protein
MPDIYVTVHETPNETCVITTPVNVTVGTPSFIASDYATTGYVDAYYYPLTNPSGYITSAQAGGVNSLVVTGANISGIITFSGVNGISITTGANNSLIWSGNGSSTNTGELTGAFYPLHTNPSGYVTGSVVRPNETGNFVTTNQTGSFVTTGQTGSFVTTGQTGNFVTTGQTGSFGGGGNTGVLTGVFYPLTSNPSGYVRSAVTGYSVTGSSSVTGRLDIMTGSGISTTLAGTTITFSVNPNYFVELTGAGGIVVSTSGNFLFVSGDTSSYVSKTMTGSSFYPRTGNPSGYVTGSIVRPDDTGNLADKNYVGSVSGVLSDRLILTGSGLLDLIQAASAGVSAINGASGILNLVGAGNVYVTTQGQTITASGDTGIYSTFITTGQTGDFGGGGNTGELTGVFYPLRSNPSGYITGNQVLGLPTDGAYGGVNGAIAGVSQGDRGEDAFDKIEVILGKLAPSKPANLSASSWVFLNTLYGAKMQGTDSSFSGIMNTLNPTGRATGFYDGDAGILSGVINEILTGSKTLSTASDTGNFSGLKITGDFDFWSGVVGRAGFWNALSALVTSTGNLPTGQFSMRMGHSVTGPTHTLTGYCNQVQTPVVTILNIQTGVSTTRIIDGVPALATNDPITLRFQVTNAISAFYAPTIGNISSSLTSTANVNATGTPLSGTTQILSGNVTVSASRYASGWTGSLFAYNASSGVSTTVTSGSNVRIDTVSTQQAERVRAGTGLYSSNFGAVYDNNLSLVSGEELQMINGYIQQPPKVDYTVVSPLGPDYRNIQTGSVGGATGVRWACYNMGTISADSAITLTFNSAQNFGGTVLTPGLYLYVKVSGATPTAGWIDGNGAYPGVGNPTNDGDLALVVGSSTASVKVITFGSTTRDGSVYVRVGLPSGSTKSFTTLTMT